MTENYNIRKSVKIDNQDISLYFRDKNSDCLIPLFDISQLQSEKDLRLKEIKELAGEKNCNVIRTSADYTIEVCNLTGLKNILSKIKDEKTAEEIITVISTFVEQETALIPNTAEEKKVGTIKSNKYFTMISVNGHSIRFVQVKDIKWFGAQDIVRFFTPLKAVVAEDQISLLNANDIANVIFPNQDVRKCITEESFVTIIKALLGNKADVIIKELDMAIQSTSIKISETTQEVKELSIDGEATSILRYAFISVSGIKGVVFRHTKKNVIIFFSVSEIAKTLKINAEGYLRRASNKKVKFVINNDIFLTINDLRSVFYGAASGNAVCDTLTNELKKSDIIEQAIEITDASEHLVLLNSNYKMEYKQSKSQEQVPVIMSNKKYVTYYCDININGSLVLVCFAKNDINNKEEMPEPWFWSTSLGYAFDISEVTKLAGLYVDEENKSKVTIPDIKKFNVRMLNLEGVRQAFSKSKKAKQVEDIIIVIKKAVNHFIDSNQYKEGIMTKKYEIRSEPVVEDKEKTVTEETKVEEPKVQEEQQLPTFDSTITYRGKTVDIKVTVVPPKTITVFYRLAQLLDSLNVEESVKEKILQNNQEFVSIFGLEDVLANDISNAADIVHNLLEHSKDKIQEALAHLNIHDDSTQEAQQEEQSVEKGVRTYILRAIILAEKYRFVLMSVKRNGKEIKGLPGPTDQKLLENLWSYIDIATIDQTISFGFQRQLVVVSERVKRLEALL